MQNAPFSRTQNLLGALTLAAALLSVFLIGGNTPVVWSLLSVFVLLVLFCQLLIALNMPLPLAVQRLSVPGFLFLAVLGWGWFQTMPNISAEHAHPLWALVPEAAPSISADPGQGRHVVMRLLCYGAIFLVTVWTCVDPRRASLMLKAIAIFTTGLSAYGLYAYSTGENIFLGSSASNSLVQSTFVNRNNYATYAIFGTLANLAAFLHISGRQTDTLHGRLDGFFSNTWIYAFGVILGIGAVSLTQSRAGGLAGLAGLLVFLLALQWGNARSRSGTWDRLMIALLCAVLVLIALTSATGLTERLFATDAEDGRFTLYPLVVQAISDRPVLGHGAGSFSDVFRSYVPPDVSGKEWARAHNTYLELAFGFGLPATVLYFGSLTLVVLRIYRGTKVRRMNRVYSCFGLACVAVAAFHSVFDFSLQMTAVAALFSVILGLAYAQSFTHAEIRQAKAREKYAPPKKPTFVAGGDL